MKHPETSERLKKWLTDNGETSESLAEKLSITLGNVKRWMAGERRPLSYLWLALQTLERTPLLPDDREVRIAALRQELRELIDQRPAIGERFCRYRKCKRKLSGQRNQEFCNSSCRAQEYRARSKEA